MIDIIISSNKTSNRNSNRKNIIIVLCRYKYNTRNDILCCYTILWHYVFTDSCGCSCSGRGRLVAWYLCTCIYLSLSLYIYIYTYTHIMYTPIIYAYICVYLSLSIHIYGIQYHMIYLHVRNLLWFQKPTFQKFVRPPWFVSCTCSCSARFEWKSEVSVFETIVRPPCEVWQERLRRRRGHPGVVLPLVISNSANHQEGIPN